MCKRAGGTCRFVAGAAEVHGPRAEISLRWMPLGRPRWAAAVWHRPPARPMEGWRVATWCSWKDAGSPGSARLMGPVGSVFWVVANFRPFLKFTGRTDLVNALNLAGVKRFHAIVPVLADGDEELVVRACASGVVSARDAAITLLALSTGLRACDIVALRMGDVDWRGHTIGLVQQKTGNPLTLPLPALLLSKLASYVLDERPSSADDHLFLRSVAPYTRLNDHATVHRVTVETFRKAGVSEPKAGTRLLRHNAASRLLAAAVPLPTIAAALGHASEESTNLYMGVDRLRLLDCVLPVPESVQ